MDAHHCSYTLAFSFTAIWEMFTDVVGYFLKTSVSLLTLKWEKNALKWKKESESKNICGSPAHSLNEIKSPPQLYTSNHQ